MRIRDFACRLASMDRYIAGFKMQRGKIPGKRFEFHLAACHLPQLCDDSLPDSFTEGAAVQVNKPANYDNSQRQTGKNYKSREFAFLHGGSGRRDVYVCFAAHGEFPALVAAAGSIRSMCA